MTQATLPVVTASSRLKVRDEYAADIEHGKRMLERLVAENPQIVDFMAEYSKSSKSPSHFLTGVLLIYRMLEVQVESERATA